MIPFIDLKAQQERIADKLQMRIKDVLSHGIYIMGPEVKEFEAALASFVGAKHCVSCSNGTDALALGIMALPYKAGQAVIVPSFTFCATAEVVAWFGMVPIFADVELDSYNISPESIEKAFAVAAEKGLEVAGIIPVDLFGLPANYEAIFALAEKHNCWVLGDAAQGLAGEYHGKRIGSVAPVTATSFFPAKPLGCYGDGGAVFTDDDAIADIMRSVRVHGKGTDKYDNVRIGMNGRLDTIQAAILLEKLAIYEDEIAARNVVAERYKAGLANCMNVTTPPVPKGNKSVWAQYTLTLAEGVNRSDVQASLKAADVPSVVYYAKPLHQQTAYKGYLTAGTLANSEYLAAHVLSLPMHPYLAEAEQNSVIEAVLNAAK